MDADVIIVGAGAAGLWAAATAAKLGVRVLLLEKTGRAGTKVLASGGTRCNLTTTLDSQKAANLYGEAAQFLAPALRALSPADVVEHFHTLGVPTTTEPAEPTEPAEHAEPSELAELAEPALFSPSAQPAETPASSAAAQQFLHGHTIEQHATRSQPPRGLAARQLAESPSEAARQAEDGYLHSWLHSVAKSSAAAATLSTTAADPPPPRPCEVFFSRADAHRERRHAQEF